MASIRILAVALTLFLAIPVQAQNPNAGWPASDVDNRVDDAVLDAVREAMGQQWKFIKSRRVGVAINEHTFESRLGGPPHILQIQLSFMRSEVEAEKCLYFDVLHTSVGGDKVMGMGDQATMWSSPGNASLQFRLGSVVARVHIRNKDSMDDVAPEVLRIGQAVADGLRESR